MEKLAPRHNFKQWLKDNRMSIIVLAAALVLFIVLRVIAAPEDAAPTTDGDYAEYENAVVTNVLSDTTFADPTADNALRGEQLLLAEVKTGRYKGETL